MTPRWLGSLSICAFLAACAQPNAGRGPAAPGTSAGAPSAGPSTASPSREEVLAERNRRDVARMHGWIAIAMGSAAGVVALYTSVEMLHEKSVRDSSCNANKVCSSDGLSANSDISAASGWNIGSWVVTAAGLGLGTFLVLTNENEPEAQTQVGVGPTGSGAGLTVRSAF